MDVKCQNRQRLYTIEDLENLLEYVPYEIWLKDKEGRHVYINQKGANKLGLKKEDIIGKTDMEIRSKEFWEKCKLTDDQVIQEKKALFYEDEFDMNKDNCYRVYKFPIKDSEDNVKLTGGLANEVIYSKYINKELEDLSNESQKLEDKNIEYIQSISRILSNLNNMIKSTNIDLFFIDESKERLNLYISCDKKNIFLKNSSININYKEFSELYDSKLKIDINNKLNYEFRKIYDPQVETNENSIFKVIPLKIDGRLIGVMYIYYENKDECIDTKDECIDTHDGFIYDVLHRISNFFINIELKNELKEKLGCDATIHMDPIVTSDEHVSEMKAAVISIIKGIDERINMHDFRVVTGPTHTNIIFDVLIPYKFQIQDDELAARITSQVRERLGNNYYVVIKVDHSYV